MSNDVNDFLLGGGGKSARLESIGDTITGTVTSAEVRQQTDIADGKPLTWDDGSPRMQLVVTLQTTLRDPSDPEDDGVRQLYVKGTKKAGSRSLHDAVASAVRRANAKALEVGGTLTVTHDGTEPSKTRGYNDRKLYSASYTAPDRAAATGDFLGTSVQQPAAQPAPAAQPVAQPAPAPAATAVPPGMTAEQEAAFRAWQATQQAQPA